MLADMLYADPAYARRGVATALFEALETEARRIGAAELHTEASIPAKPFFEQAGFEVIAVQTKMLAGILFQNFSMRKMLIA